MCHYLGHEFCLHRSKHEICLLRLLLFKGRSFLWMFFRRKCLRFHISNIKVNTEKLSTMISTKPFGKSKETEMAFWCTVTDKKAQAEKDAVAPPPSLRLTETVDTFCQLDLTDTKTMPLPFYYNIQAQRLHPLLGHTGIEATSLTMTHRHIGHTLY